MNFGLIFFFKALDKKYKYEEQQMQSEGEDVSLSMEWLLHLHWRRSAFRSERVRAIVP